MLLHRFKSLPGAFEMLLPIAHLQMPASGRSQFVTFVRGEVAIAGERLEETGDERSIDALEPLEEEQADGIALVGETVATPVGQFFEQTFGAQFGKIVAQRCQAVLGLGKSESVQHRRVEDYCHERFYGINPAKWYVRWDIKSEALG
jgi:hypothetical protein